MLQVEFGRVGFRPNPKLCKEQPEHLVRRPDLDEPEEPKRTRVAAHRMRHGALEGLGAQSPPAGAAAERGWSVLVQRTHTHAHSMNE